MAYDIPQVQGSITPWNIPDPNLVTAKLAQQALQAKLAQARAAAGIGGGGHGRGGSGKGAGGDIAYIKNPKTGMMEPVWVPGSTEKARTAAQGAIQHNVDMQALAQDGEVQKLSGIINNPNASNLAKQEALNQVRSHIKGTYRGLDDSSKYDGYLDSLTQGSVTAVADEKKRQEDSSWLTELADSFSIGLERTSNWFGNLFEDTETQMRNTAESNRRIEEMRMANPDLRETELRRREGRGMIETGGGVPGMLGNLVTGMAEDPVMAAALPIAAGAAVFGGPVGLGVAAGVGAGSSAVSSNMALKERIAADPNFTTPQQQAQTYDDMWAGDAAMQAAIGGTLALAGPAAGKISQGVARSGLTRFGREAAAKGAQAADQLAANATARGTAAADIVAANAATRGEQLADWAVARSAAYGDQAAAGMADKAAQLGVKYTDEYLGNVASKEAADYLTRFGAESADPAALRKALTDRIMAKNTAKFGVETTDPAVLREAFVNRALTKDFARQGVEAADPAAMRAAFTRNYVDKASAAYRAAHPFKYSTVPSLIDAAGLSGGSMLASNLWYNHGTGENNDVWQGVPEAGLAGLMFGVPGVVGGHYLQSRANRKQTQGVLDTLGKELDSNIQAESKPAPSSDIDSGLPPARGGKNAGKGSGDTLPPTADPQQESGKAQPQQDGGVSKEQLVEQLVEDNRAKTAAADAEKASQDQTGQEVSGAASEQGTASASFAQEVFSKINSAGYSKAKGQKRKAYNVISDAKKAEKVYDQVASFLQTDDPNVVLSELNKLKGTKVPSGLKVSNRQQMPKGLDSIISVAKNKANQYNAQKQAVDPNAKTKPTAEPNAQKQAVDPRQTDILDINTAFNDKRFSDVRKQFSKMLTEVTKLSKRLNKGEQISDTDVQRYNDIVNVMGMLEDYDKKTAKVGGVMALNKGLRKRIDVVKKQAKNLWKSNRKKDVPYRVVPKNGYKVTTNPQDSGAGTGQPSQGGTADAQSGKASVDTQGGTADAQGSNAGTQQPMTFNGHAIQNLANGLRNLIAANSYSTATNPYSANSVYTSYVRLYFNGDKTNEGVRRSLHMIKALTPKRYTGYHAKIDGVIAAADKFINNAKGQYGHDVETPGVDSTASTKEGLVSFIKEKAPQTSGSAQGSTAGTQQRGVFNGHTVEALRGGLRNLIAACRNAKRGVFTHYADLAYEYYVAQFFNNNPFDPAVRQSLYAIRNSIPPRYTKFISRIEAVIEVAEQYRRNDPALYEGTSMAEAENAYREAADKVAQDVTARESTTKAFAKIAEDQKPYSSTTPALLTHEQSVAFSKLYSRLRSIKIAADKHAETDGKSWLSDAAAKSLDEQLQLLDKAREVFDRHAILRAYAFHLSKLIRGSEGTLKLSPGGKNQRASRIFGTSVSPLKTYEQFIADVRDGSALPERTRKGEVVSLTPAQRRKIDLSAGTDAVRSILHAIADDPAISKYYFHTQESLKALNGLLRAAEYYKNYYGKMAEQINASQRYKAPEGKVLTEEEEFGFQDSLPKYGEPESRRNKPVNETDYARQTRAEEERIQRLYDKRSADWAKQRTTKSGGDPTIGDESIQVHGYDKHYNIQDSAEASFRNYDAFNEFYRPYAETPVDDQLPARFRTAEDTALDVAMVNDFARNKMSRDQNGTLRRQNLLNAEYDAIVRLGSDVLPFDLANPEAAEHLQGSSETVNTFLKAIRRLNSELYPSLYEDIADYRYSLAQGDQVPSRSQFSVQFRQYLDKVLALPKDRIAPNLDAIQYDTLKRFADGVVSPSDEKAAKAHAETASILSSILPSMKDGNIGRVEQRRIAHEIRRVSRKELRSTIARELRSSFNTDFVLKLYNALVKAQSGKRANNKDFLDAIHYLDKVTREALGLFVPQIDWAKVTLPSDVKPLSRKAATKYYQHLLPKEVTFSQLMDSAKAFVERNGTETYQVIAANLTNKFNFKQASKLDARYVDSFVALLELNTENMIKPSANLPKLSSGGQTNATGNNTAGVQGKAGSASLRANDAAGAGTSNPANNGADSAVAAHTAGAAGTPAVRDASAAGTGNNTAEGGGAGSGANEGTPAVKAPEGNAGSQGSADGGEIAIGGRGAEPAAAGDAADGEGAGEFESTPFIRSGGDADARSDAEAQLIENLTEPDSTIAAEPSQRVFPQFLQKKLMEFATADDGVLAAMLKGRSSSDLPGIVDSLDSWFRNTVAIAKHEPLSPEDARALELLTGQAKDEYTWFEILNRDPNSVFHEAFSYFLHDLANTRLRTGENSADNSFASKAAVHSVLLSDLMDMIDSAITVDARLAGVPIAEAPLKKRNAPLELKDAVDEEIDRSNALYNKYDVERYEAEGLVDPALTAQYRMEVDAILSGVEKNIAGLSYRRVVDSLQKELDQASAKIAPYDKKLAELDAAKKAGTISPAELDKQRKATEETIRDLTAKRNELAAVHADAKVKSRTIAFAIGDYTFDPRSSRLVSSEVQRKLLDAVQDKYIQAIVNSAGVKYLRPARPSGDILKARHEERERAAKLAEKYEQDASQRPYITGIYEKPNMQRTDKEHTLVGYVADGNMRGAKLLVDYSESSIRVPQYDMEHAQRMIEGAVYTALTGEGTISAPMRTFLHAVRNYKGALDNESLGTRLAATKSPVYRKELDFARVPSKNERSMSLQNLRSHSTAEQTELRMQIIDMFPQEVKRALEWADLDPWAKDTLLGKDSEEMYGNMLRRSFDEQAAYEQDHSFGSVRDRERYREYQERTNPGNYVDPEMSAAERMEWHEYYKNNEPEMFRAEPNYRYTVVDPAKMENGAAPQTLKEFEDYYSNLSYTDLVAEYKDLAAEMKDYLTDYTNQDYEGMSQMVQAEMDNIRGRIEAVEDALNTINDYRLKKHWDALASEGPLLKRMRAADMRFDPARRASIAKPLNTIEHVISDTDQLIYTKMHDGLYPDLDTALASTEFTVQDEYDKAILRAWTGKDNASWADVVYTNKELAPIIKGLVQDAQLAREAKLQAMGIGPGVWGPDAMDYYRSNFYQDAADAIQTMAKKPVISLAEANAETKSSVTKLCN